MPVSGWAARWRSMGGIALTTGHQASMRCSRLNRIPIRKTVTSVSAGAVNRPGWTRLIEASCRSFITTL